MKKGFFIAAVVFLTSCSLLQSKKPQFSQVGKAEQDLWATIADQQKAGKFAEVLQSTETYQKQFPYSLKLQQVRFAKASALEELERWSEAADTYRVIAVFSERHQPEISAMSIYRLSFVYEAMGEDEKVLTSLLEAQKYPQCLPMEVSKAEIPSRMAMVYAKQNNANEAQRWLKDADKGLKETLDSRREPLTPAWLAEIYYQMGSISTQQLSQDNIQTIILGQQAVQKYLIRALQYDDPYWSKKALSKLKDTYEDLWKAIEQFPEPSGYEPAVAQKIKRDEQFKILGPFMNLMNEAQLYRPLAEQKISPMQTEFFTFIEALQAKAQNLMQDPFYTPLMPGRDKTPQKPKGPVKIAPSEDPNI